MAASREKLTVCSIRWTRVTAIAEVASNVARLSLLALFSAGCFESQELFPSTRSSAADAAVPDAAPGSGTQFHLVSIGAHAQTDDSGMVNGLGAAIILKDQEILFWGNGGEAAGRGFAVLVVDPLTRNPIGAAEHFDTYRTRETGGQEAFRLVSFLDGVGDGMLVLLVVGDEGLTLGADRSCSTLPDENARSALDALTALGSSLIQEYCYRASWAMAAYKGSGRAEAEDLRDGEPVHLLLTLPSR
jgi:Interleukin-like EMT inducer